MSTTHTCPDCHGSGSVCVSHDPWDKAVELCPKCRGCGYLYDPTGRACSVEDGAARPFFWGVIC